VTETDAIRLAERPATVASLTRDLRAIGLGIGVTVMVHSSLSHLGYVAGGAHAVVLALFEAVGPTGTVVMPTHSSGLSDPADWQDPPVPASWWDPIRAAMPAFDPLLTPTRRMGAVVECFRHVEGVRRSDHPTVSAAAVGPSAATVVAGHQLADGLGESSPQARLYDLDGWILLLGVTHANNTSLHLSEHRADFPDKRRTTRGAPVLIDGQRRWVSYEDLEDDSDDFDLIGRAFAETGAETSGRVGAGVARLCRSRAVVDFGVAWMEAHRVASG
jgi:aminoglycoside 3-N-acetyltransferase